MKKIGILVCALVAVSMFYGCGGAGKGKMVVEINGSKITEGDLEFLGTINPRIQAQLMTPDGKKRLLDNLIEQELMYQKAMKEGINRKDDVKAKIDLYRRVIISQSLVDAKIEEAAKKYYDEHPEEFQKLKLSQIMIKYANPEEAKKAKGKKGEVVRSEADALKLANTVKARLDKGEDFATVAKEVSEDPTTKARGGDLGAVSKGDKRLDARGWGPIGEKAFEMKVGEIAGPIKTNSGYHLIVVTQGVEVEPFETAKTAITFKIRNDVKNQLLADLRKDSKIEYAESEKALAEKKEGAPEAQAPVFPVPAKPEGEKTVTAPAPGSAPVKAPAVKVAPLTTPELTKPDVKQLAKEAPKAATEKPASSVKKPNVPAE